jgi:nucleotide-binding universal stress UspA family protein
MACDDSDHAMHAVDYVCRLHPASVSIDVLLVNVQLPILSGNVRRHVTKEMIDTYYREEGEQALRRAARALTKAGIAHESCVMAGHVAETLVQMAEQHRCTRIVMGTRGLGAVGNIVLGSVAYKVLHLASTPVTLVK